MIYDDDGIEHFSGDTRCERIAKMHRWIAARARIGSLICLLCVGDRLPFAWAVDA